MNTYDLGWYYKNQIIAIYKYELRELVVDEGWHKFSSFHDLTIFSKQIKAFELAYLTKYLFRA